MDDRGVLTAENFLNPKSTIAEFAELQMDGQHCRGEKLQEYKMTDEVAGVEIA